MHYASLMLRSRKIFFHSSCIFSWRWSRENFATKSEYVYTWMHVNAECINIIWSGIHMMNTHDEGIRVDFFKLREQTGDKHTYTHIPTKHLKFEVLHRIRLLSADYTCFFFIVLAHSHHDNTTQQIVIKYPCAKILLIIN